MTAIPSGSPAPVVYYASGGPSTQQRPLIIPQPLRPTGAWVVYNWGWHTLVKAVFVDELEARRWADSQGYELKVKFCPWGELEDM